jgi:hypothetical protein
MKYKLLPFCIAVLLLVFAGGCKKNIVPGGNNGGGGDSTGKDTDVYLTGYISYSPHISTATYWKNGIPSSLTGGIGGYANSIAVSGNDIYVSGNEYFSPFGPGKAVYWKNGVMVALANGSDTATHTNEIAISGNDVYVVGSSGHEEGAAESPYYWKNGVAVKLGSQGLSSPFGAICITFSGTDLYIAGGDSIGICYWKNGVRFPLQTDAEKVSDFPTAIAVSGNDVYVTGYSSYAINQTNNDYDVACYWKNGVKIPLKDTSTGNPSDNNTIAQTIAITGNDVYIGGYTEYDNNVSAVYLAVYWKNGGLPISVGKTEYMENESGLYLTASGNDLYFAYVQQQSTDSFIPSYYKFETVPIQCSNTLLNQAGITSIAVVAK